MSLPKKVLTH
jgi:large subunit ribosomal protein LP2